MAHHQVPCGDVTAAINFYLPPPDDSQPFDYADEPPPGLPQRNYGDISQQVQIHDIRGHELDFTLDRDAFQVLKSLPASAEKLFLKDDSIKEKYYPEIETLLLDQIPGAARVFIFDHTVRRADPESHRSPVQKAHVDQTAASVEQRIRLYFPDEADQLLKQRYRLINVWRPLNEQPVQSFPLAFASSSTLEDKDFIPVTHHHKDGYTGKTASIVYNEGQKWFYLSGMENTEAILLECFDSESLKPGSDINGRVPHSAFFDPRTPYGAEPRTSIEVRTLVFGP